MSIQVDIVPAQRHHLGPAQTGRNHQARQGVVAYAHSPHINRLDIQQLRQLGPVQRSLAAAAAALIGFPQPVEYAQHMCFPRLAGGEGDITLVQEGQVILVAEVHHWR